MNEIKKDRRNFLKLGSMGVAVGTALMASKSMVNVDKAYAQAARDSVLRRVLDRGKLIVGTGSTNAPWHFEDEKGRLAGMDIAMAEILAVGLFNDKGKIEYIRQAPDARIPNIVTNKVDIVIQFMTVSPERAQVVAFSRPYYFEGVALLTRPGSRYKTYKQLVAAGSRAKVSVLQNVYAEEMVHDALPKCDVMMVDTVANSIQAMDAGRSDAVALDLSTVRWLVVRNPGRYTDAGHGWWPQVYSAAVKQGEPDWLHFVNTVFNIAMFAQQYHHLYAGPYEQYFGEKPPKPRPGFPTF